MKNQDQYGCFWSTQKKNVSSKIPASTAIRDFVVNPPAAKDKQLVIREKKISSVSKIQKEKHLDGYLANINPNKFR